MELVLAFALFGSAMIAMSVGVILSDRVLKSSCGGAAELDGLDSCSACGKKAVEMCPSDAELVRIAQLGHPNPTHHRL